MRFTGFMLLAACLVVQTANAQKKEKRPSKDTTASKVDSTMEEDVKNAISGDIPVVTLDDNDLGDGSSQNISSVLTAG